MTSWIPPGRSCAYTDSTAVRRLGRSTVHITTAAATGACGSRSAASKRQPAGDLSEDIAEAFDVAAVTLRDQRARLLVVIAAIVRVRRRVEARQRSGDAQSAAN